YSKITNPNSVHQCDLIEIPYDEDVDTGFSEEVAEAFKSIYNNPDNPLNWAQLLQYNQGHEFIGSVTLIMDEHNVNI
ncbi:17794_t:CDS:2, partial [Dentiscutata erythropus]